MRQRWIFTEAEIVQVASGKLIPNALDEFIVGVPSGINEGESLSLIAYRNGDISNRWSDGTVGVPWELKELAGDEEEYVTLNGEVADQWRDVETDEDGKFVALLQPLYVGRADGKWHVFNGGCQVAGPYGSEAEAHSVRREMSGEVASETPT